MMDSIFIGGADAEGTGTPNVAQNLLLKIANRHGLIAGATGTGKTVTLQNLAQGFSDAGVPVFCADVKGDLSGICIPGSTDHKLHDKFVARANKIGLGEYEYTSAPTVFWDVFGEKGHPIRTTISEMGPLLLSRLMDLTDAQEGVLNIAFEYADDNGLLLLDLSRHEWIMPSRSGNWSLRRMVGSVIRMTPWLGSIIANNHRANFVDLLAALSLIVISVLIIDFAIGFVTQAYFIDEGSPDPGGLPHRWLLRSFIPVSFAILVMQSVSNLLKTDVLVFRRRRVTG